MSDQEKILDEKLKDTHNKKSYSFTKEEAAALHELDRMCAYLLKAYQLQSNDVVALMLQRIGVQRDSGTQVVYDLSANTCLVYQPKK